MSARADLHCHTKHSDQPGSWVLRQLGAPESFTEPAEIYRRCRERGMDFVTVSDHDSIAGGLEIAHLPGTFLSCEVTARFPEDGCLVHCLVIGVSEAQFAEIDRLRSNLYELRDYLCGEDILCSVAHPLYRVNDRLTAAHWEKLLLLFKRFELVNGARDPQAGLLAQAILENLTPEILWNLAERHGIDPRDPEPWVKHATGGSDDHSGLYLAAAWTETPPASNVEEYLAHLRRGDHRPGGEAGSSLKLARCFYSIALEYLDRRRAGANGQGDLVGELLRRVLDGGMAPPTWRSRMRTGAARLALAGRAAWSSESISLAGEMLKVASHPAPGPAASVERRCLEAANRLTEAAVSAALDRAVGEIKAGRLAGAFRAATELVPHLAALAPYLASFHTQHKDDGFLRDLAARLPTRRGEAARRVVDRPRKKAWFTDTLTEVNGVARTIRETAALAREKGADLTVITATSALIPAGLPVTNFRPLREVALPEYESIPLALPPFLELLDHCEQEGFTEIIVSTPGPVGLAGLAAARLLGLPATGIYHTDFPAYAGLLTGNPVCEQLAHGYMEWFYGACARVYAPSRAYAETLRRAGLPGERLRLLPRGVDHRLFHPGRRRPELWRECGLSGACRFLYVGRVSKEKNLDLLLAAFRALLARRPDADLIVVGDGPYLEELAARHSDPRILFTGFLHGAELAAAYASADVFVFPSATDTFGNAVLEAHASGLPAVVADAGGPPEIVREHRSGLVFDPTDAGELAAGMERLMLDRELRAAMGRRALEHARGASWENLLAELWGEEPLPATAANEEDPAAAEGWEELLATA